MTANRRSLFLRLSAALLFCSPVSGCASEVASEDIAPDDDAQISLEATSSAEDPGLGRRLDINATEFRFSPSQIFAQPGETLFIALRNNGRHPHSIVFDLPGGHQGPPGTVPPGGVARFTVHVPRRPGQYSYYCPLDDHRRRGMQGYLHVVYRR